MATLDDQIAQLQKTTPENRSMEWFGGEDAGWARSMAAAIPSGFLKIFEGAATLGAALLDLGVDKDRVEAVEQYFADINPFLHLNLILLMKQLLQLVLEKSQNL